MLFCWVLQSAGLMPKSFADKRKKVVILGCSRQAEINLLHLKGITSDRSRDDKREAPVRRPLDPGIHQSLAFRWIPAELDAETGRTDLVFYFVSR